MAQRADRPRLLRIDQAVAKLHALGMDDIGKKWFYNQFQRGKLRNVKINGKVRIREDKLDAVIDRMLKS